MSKEAMKLALEFVEYHSKYWNGEGQHPQEIATALREALAEQPAQQEPIAWCVYCDGQFTLNIYRSEDLANFRAAALEEQYPRYKREVVPLYTSPPPQRTWVGLTDEEIYGIEGVEMKYDGTGEYYLEGEYEFAKAIEAKLKDKNT